MGTRRSKHNKGVKPLYKEHRLVTPPLERVVPPPERSPPPQSDPERHASIMAQLSSLLRKEHDKERADATPAEVVRSEASSVEVYNVKLKRRARMEGGEYSGSRSDLLWEGANGFYTTYLKQLWSLRGEELGDVSLLSGRTLRRMIARAERELEAIHG